jgi:hypothetical protein
VAEVVLRLAGLEVMALQAVAVAVLTVLFVAAQVVME